MKETRTDLLLKENLEDIIYVYFRFKKHKVYKPPSEGEIEEGRIMLSQMQFYMLFLISANSANILIQTSMSQIQLYNNLGLLPVLVIDILVMLFPIVGLYKLLCTIHFFKTRRLVLNDTLGATYSRNDIKRFRPNKPKLLDYNRSINLFILNDKYAYANRSVLLDKDERQDFKRKSMLKTVFSFTILIYITYIIFT